jgi:leucyl aminopeptidase
MTPENKNTKEVKRLELLASEKETEVLEKLIESNKIDKQTIFNYRSALESSRQYKEATALQKLKVFAKMLILRVRAKRKVDQSQIDHFKSSILEVQKVMRIVHHHVTLALKAEQNKDNVLEVSIVLNQYYSRLRNIRRRRENKQNYPVVASTQPLKLESLYLQRHYLDELISNKQVDATVAAQVRENINYNEIVIANEK